MIESILEDYSSNLNITEKILFQAKLTDLNKRLCEESIQEDNVVEKVQECAQFENDFRNSSIQNSKLNPFLSEEEEDEYFWDDEFSFLQKTTSFMPLHSCNALFNVNYSSANIMSTKEEPLPNDVEKQKMVQKICESQIKIAKLNDEKDILENHIHDLNLNLEQKKR